jgi:hypothetical protein
LFARLARNCVNQIRESHFVTQLMPIYRLTVTRIALPFALMSINLFRVRVIHQIYHVGSPDLIYAILDWDALVAWLKASVLNSRRL